MPITVSSLGFLAALAVDPTDSAVVYAGLAYSIARSADGGASWRLLPRHLEDFPQIRTIAVDPRHPATLYATGTDIAVPEPLACIAVKSQDFGRHWTCLEAPGVGSTVDFLVLDPTRPATIYAHADALVQSTDGGLTWHDLHFDEELRALAVDPLRPAMLYADSPLDLWTSDDAGRSWGRAENGLPHGTFGALAIDRRDRAAAYVVVTGQPGEGEVFRSRDGGASWAPTGGGLPPSLTQLVVDPRHRAALYLGTLGHGVYHLVR